MCVKYLAHCQAYWKLNLNGSYCHHQNLQCVPLPTYSTLNLSILYLKEAHGYWALLFHQFNLQTSIPTKVNIFLLPQSQVYFSSFRPSFITHPLTGTPFSSLAQPKQTFQFTSHLVQEAWPNHSHFYSFLLLSKTLTHTILYYLLLSNISG